MQIFSKNRDIISKLTSTYFDEFFDALLKEKA